MHSNGRPDVLVALGSRLSDRARRSVQAHREYRTLRREDRPWSETSPGCEQATLCVDTAARATVYRLSAGAVVPWPEDCKAQEVLVLQGRLRAAATGSAVESVMSPQAYALRGDKQAGRLVAVDADTQVYVRHLLVEPAALPALEAQWWRLPRAPLQVVMAGARRWRPNFPGVEVMALWGHATTASMLVRFAPGACVPDHAHALNEDCLVLEGEMFLGDILLRPGDYQLAPAGGTHFGEMSDVGCTFFFHGAIDPVLVP